MHQPGRCLQRPRVVDSWGSRASWRGWVDCGQSIIPFVDDTDSEVDRTRRLCRLVQRAKMTLADNKQTNKQNGPPPPQPKPQSGDFEIMAGARAGAVGIAFLPTGAKDSRMWERSSGHIQRPSGVQLKRHLRAVSDTLNRI